MSSPQGNNKKRNKKKCSNELLNFRFENKPTTQPLQQRYPTKKNYKPIQSHALLPDFPLYTCSLYGFLLSPWFELAKQRLDHKHRPCCSWSTDVWMVKVLLSSDMEQLSCPICLSHQPVSPRMTKCGHVYCLPCLLRYMSYSTAAATCPCCTMTTCSDEWKPILVETIQPPRVGSSMEFVKLHKSNKDELSAYLATSTTSCNKPSFPCLDQNNENCNYSRFNTISLDRYQEEVLASLQQLQDYRAQQVDDEIETSFVDAAMAFVQAQEVSRLQNESLSEESRNNNAGESKNNNTTGRKSRKNQGVFLNQDEVQFYQSKDGQVCFLSAFNMKCLTTEFSTHEPEEDQSRGEDASKANKGATKSSNKSNKFKPLPSKIKGRVLDVKHVQLTPNHRYVFLSHLPLYMDVLFVELDLNHLLSVTTRELHKKEFQSKKLARQKAKRAERKLQKHQEEQLARKQRQQQLVMSSPSNPTRTALQEQVESGGFPSIVNNDSSPVSDTTTPTPPPTAFRFSQVCATNGVWPELNDSSSRQTTTRTAGARGSSKEAPPPPQPSLPPPKRGKQKKKKIVLFSTGGGGYGSSGRTW